MLYPQRDLILVTNTTFWSVKAIFWSRDSDNHQLIWTILKIKCKLISIKVIICCIYLNIIFQEWVRSGASAVKKKLKQKKNHTHVKKVGHNPKFLFGIYWWTWKTNKSRPIKDKIILTFTMLHFLNIIKKHLEISLFYTCVPKTLMIWSTVPEIWHVTDRNL